jgi:plastocyanin
MRQRNWLGLATAVFLAGACSNNSYGTSSSCTPTAIQVCMVNTAYSPATRTVAAGTTVTWINGDGFSHTVTNDAGSTETFNQTVGAAATFAHQFNTGGTYNYHCTIHANMHGSIVVN